MGISYAIPYRPPAPKASPWTRLRMTWTAKGVTWPLTSPASGLFLMPGIRGLGTVSTERHSTTSPAVAGSKHEGISVLTVKSSGRSISSLMGAWTKSRGL